MKKVCVVLVTYDRKKLLGELLEDLTRQTYPISGLVIVNNCSTDGTEISLQKMGVIERIVPSKVVKSKWKDMDVFYYQSQENTGGSGGFARAFQIAETLEYDYVWAMDDDVSPEEDCLEILLGQMNEETQVCIPSRNDENWKEYVITDYNLSNPFLFKLEQIKTRKAVSEVSGDFINVVDMPLEGPLFTMQLLKKIGIPNKDYFIMFDDTDFAHRASMETNIKFVTKAILHRKLAPQVSYNNELTWKSYYLMRNQFYFDHKYGKNFMVKHFRPGYSALIKEISRACKGQFYAVRWVRRAYRDAIRGNMGRTVEPGTPIK